MCCHSGTGRCSLTTTSVSPRTVTSQSANSSALDTVADNDTRATLGGRWMITSSQTATAEPVGEEVHLVHDHVRQAPQRRRAGVEHVAQHLGGHHHHRCVTVDRVVAGEQPYPLSAVTFDQVVVLLVGQRLDRRGVEALAGAAAQGQVHGELAHHRLAGAGGRAHQHPAAPLERLAGVALEIVEVETESAANSVERRVRRPPSGGGVPLGGTSHTRKANAPAPALPDGQVVSTRNAAGTLVTVTGSGRHRSPSA